jgi:hypothetical protein
MDTISATVLVVAAAVAMTSGSISSTPAGEASAAAQFDFWLGSWELTSGGKPAGTNTITREYDGAVIMERFAGTGENALRGMSVSVFNKNTGRWNQTWVDNQGGYLDFEGGFDDGKMILSRRATIQGKDVVQRMVWFNITADSFDWNWERSDDDGATWNTLWPIHYERSKQ